MNVVELNCRTCSRRLERQELEAGQCVFCQSQEIEAEVWALERAREEELAAGEQQEILWA